MRLTALAAGFLAAATIFVVGSNKAHAQTPTNTNVSPTPPQVVETIQPGDSLSKIAARHNTTYVRIFDANLDIQDPNLIYPGHTVRIPDASEQLASRQPQVVATPVAKPVKATVVRPVVVKAQPQVVAAVAPSTDGVWDRLAQCESGGNWSINTGNGFYGGLQFTLSSWHGVGGSGYPNQASRDEQIARAEQLKARQGWGAWPACSAKLGLR